MGKGTCHPDTDHLRTVSSNEMDPLVENKVGRVHRVVSFFFGFVGSHTMEGAVNWDDFAEGTILEPADLAVGLAPDIPEPSCLQKRFLQMLNEV